MNRLPMPEEMTIYCAAELHQQLSGAVVAGAEVELALGGVAEIDSCGVQLLLAARRSAAEMGAVLRLSDASAAVREAFGLLSLAHCLEPDAASTKGSAA